MHKKVQSLLITGVLSANMVGSTVAVFADDIKKENGIKTEEAAKPNGENIEWETTTKENYEKLWDFKPQGEDIIILEKYKGNSKNVEIPRKIGDKKVVLDKLNKDVFPKVECIKVQNGTELIKLNQTNLRDAFAESEYLKYLDLRGIDVSKVTDLSGFLADISQLKKVDLSGWDVSKVEDLSSLFASDKNLEEVNLSEWNILNGTSMRAMFYGLSSLEKLNISNWKTSSKLVNTYSMFYGCSRLESLNLSGFNMHNVINAGAMFQNCSLLTEIKGTENWTLENVTDIGLIFSGTKLNFVDLSKVKLPEKSKLPDESMKNLFSSIDNSQKLLIATKDDRLKEYKYQEDKRTHFDITFDTNKGKFSDGKETERIEEIIITPEKLKLLSKPIRDKYTFDGWGKPDSNNILHANWNEVVQEEKPSNPGTGQGSGKPEEEKPSNPGTGQESGKPEEEKPSNPGTGQGSGKPEEEKPSNPGTGQGSGRPEEEKPSNPGTGQESGKPEEEKPSNPGTGQESGKPEGEKPSNPGTGQGSGKPEEEKPSNPGTGQGSGRPEEEKPTQPGGGTNNDNIMVEPPVLDGTDKDNIMIHPLECLPSVYELIDENMVSITQRGDGTENNPLILQVKDTIYKVDLTHFITKFDTLNSNVSTIKRNDTYTEYSITVDNKNATSSIKKTAPAINDKITFVKLRINNTKIDLIKEANRYSRRRNYDIKIPIIVKFSDVKDNFWGRSCIEEFASMGVVDGYPNNEFKPNNSITRAEFVRIINNAFGYTKPATNVKFNDVEKNSWYYNDIAIGLEQGYINGRSETTFSPNDNITREEVAMILTNIMNNKDNDFNRLNNFNDGKKTSDWAKSAMSGAIKAGYLIGDDQKNLSPTKNMTRAEAIASLSRVRPVK